MPSVSDPYSFFPDPDPEVEAGGQYGSGSGLEKTRVFFFKPSPVGFFGFFCFFWGFFAQTRGFIGFISVSRTLLGASRLYIIITLTN